MRLIRGVNLTLIVILAILMIWNFSDLTGKATYDFPEVDCLYHTEDGTYPIPLDRCCLEIQAQLKCDLNENQYTCYIVENSNHYTVDKKTFSYCKEVGYNVG